ncbi:hypothetical protein BDV34DRAFT_196771, partial [Aspergillus parasiticus]
MEFYIIVCDNHPSYYEVCYKACELSKEAPHGYTKRRGKEGEGYVSLDEMEKAWKAFGVYKDGMDDLGIKGMHNWRELPSRL